VEGPIDQLDHGANHALYGGKVAIDGTRKWKEEGYAREWPEVARMSAEVEARVDAMWGELGIPGGGGATGSGTDKANGSGNGGGRKEAVARIMQAAREIVRGHS
jgi:hypothetical protein